MKSFGKITAVLSIWALCFCIAVPTLSAQGLLKKAQNAVNSTKEKTEEKTKPTTETGNANANANTSTNAKEAVSPESAKTGIVVPATNARTTLKSFPKETETPPQPWEIADEQSLTTGHGIVNGRRLKGSVTATFKDGVLTIKGPGVMKEFATFEPRPWGAIRNEIKSVVVEDDVYNIGSHAFMGCENLTSVKLGKTLVKIGDGAFCNCTSLTELNIPKTVTKIGSGTGLECRTFDKCISLTAINVEAGNTEYQSDKGVLYQIGQVWTLMCYPAAKKGTSYKINDKTRFVWDGAFAFNPEIAEVTYPDETRDLGRLAFEDCPNIQSVILMGPSVKNIMSARAVSNSEFKFCSFAGVDVSKLKITVPAAMVEAYTTKNFDWEPYKNNIAAGNF